MSLMHHTQTHTVPQGVYHNEEDWQRLLTRLPQGWKEQALLQGAWQRVRKLTQIEDLLRALLLFAAWGYSFQQLGLWGTLMGIGSLSERAWRKRLERSKPWITWMLGALIGSQLTPSWLPGTVQRILLHDGSRVKVPAGCGDDVRLHCTYDLRAGRLVQMKMTDRHSAEGVHHIELQTGDVVVTDAGYHLGSSLKVESHADAFGVHRLAAHQVRLEREDGTKIDLKRLVKHQKYGTVCEYLVWVWDSTHQERFEVRLLISLLPRKQAMQARARKKARVREKQGTKGGNSASIWWAGVMMIGTTLPKETWSMQDVIRLYRSRWQIELLFKRLKTGLHLYLMPVKVWERVQTYIHLCLLVWALQEQEAQRLGEQLRKRMQEEPERDLEWHEDDELEEEAVPVRYVLSLWKLTQFTLENLRILLRGSCTDQRIDDCEAQLQRYLFSPHRDKRPSQYEEDRRWLLQMFGGPQMVPCAT